MDLQPIRVLLADDHRHIHEIVTTILRDVFDIELLAHASNGHEALFLCQEHQPDIVLMDIVMPIMNGLEATQNLRQQYPKIKILAILQKKVYGILVLSGSILSLCLKYFT